MSIESQNEIDVTHPGRRKRPGHGARSMIMEQPKRLPALDEVTQAVSDFYERHPYPPPVDDLSRYARSWTDARRRAEACLLWPDQSYRDDRNILVAGCGTSQAAKVALRWPHAHVTGIDITEQSIQSNEALRQRHEIGNLELRQLTLENAAELGRRFDHIICTGVLHHLPDPGWGLQELHDVLTPDGAMHLMVYAPYGRVGVYLLQQYCREIGIGATAAEICDLAASLRCLPPNHPLVPLLQHSPDFRSEAGIADALLHPQDRSYSVPELFDFLEGADLEFGRWGRQAAYLPQCGALAVSPHRPLLERLPLARQYAAAELFRGTMVRHSFIAYRSDRRHRNVVDFSGNDWHDYVPVRLPDTVMVEERLPPGAAAVLVHTAHTSRDISLPLNAAQKRMVEAIDGRRSIAQIAPDREQREAARILFQDLWRNDQVVFDLSRMPGQSEADPAIQ
jgi:SAM-dependent methyltransferase